MPYTDQQKKRLLWTYRGAGLPDHIGEVAAQSASASPIIGQQVSQQAQQDKQRGTLLAQAIKSGNLKPDQLSSTDLNLVRPNLDKGEFGGGFLSDVGNVVGNLGSDIWNAAKGIPQGLVSTGSAVGHDILQGFTGGQGDSQILSQIVNPVVKSYEYTYGGKGAPKGSDFWHRLAAHPLGPILDAATVASLGAGGAIRGATAVSRAGEGGIATSRPIQALVRAGQTSGRDPLVLNPGNQERAGVQFPEVPRRYSSRPLMKLGQVGWDKLSENLKPISNFDTNRTVKRLQRQSHATGLSAESAAVRAAVTPLVGSRKDLSTAEATALDYALRGWNTPEKIQTARQMFSDSLEGKLPEGWNIGDFEGFFKSPEDARAFVQYKATLPPEVEDLILHPTPGMLNAAQATHEAAQEGFTKLGISDEDIASRVSESQRILEDYRNGRLGQDPPEGPGPDIGPDPNPPVMPDDPLAGGPTTPIREELEQEYSSPDELMASHDEVPPTANDLGLLKQEGGTFGFGDTGLNRAVREILRQNHPGVFDHWDDLADSFFEVADELSFEFDEGRRFGSWDEFIQAVEDKAHELHGDVLHPPVEPTPGGPSPSQPMLDDISNAVYGKNWDELTDYEQGQIADAEGFDLNSTVDDSRPISETDPELAAELNAERDYWGGEDKPLGIEGKPLDQVTGDDLRGMVLEDGPGMDDAAIAEGWPSANDMDFKMVRQLQAKGWLETGEPGLSVHLDTTGDKSWIAVMRDERGEPIAVSRATEAPFNQDFEHEGHIQDYEEFALSPDADLDALANGLVEHFRGTEGNPFAGLNDNLDIQVPDNLEGLQGFWENQAKDPENTRDIQDHIEQGNQEAPPFNRVDPSQSFDDFLREHGIDPEKLKNDSEEYQHLEELHSQGYMSYDSIDDIRNSQTFLTMWQEMFPDEPLPDEISGTYEDINLGILGRAMDLEEAGLFPNGVDPFDPEDFRKIARNLMDEDPGDTLRRELNQTVTGYEKWLQTHPDGKLEEGYSPDADRRAQREADMRREYESAKAQLDQLGPPNTPNEPPPSTFDFNPDDSYPIQPTYVPNLPAAGFQEQRPGRLARMFGAEDQVFTRGKRQRNVSAMGVTAQNMFSQAPESYLRERPEILASGASRIDTAAFVESVARREKDIVQQGFNGELLGRLAAKDEVGEPLKFQNQEEVYKRLGADWVVVNEQFPISWFSAESNFAADTVNTLEQLRVQGKSAHDPEVEQIISNLADSHARDFVRSAFSAQKLDGVAIPREFFNYQRRLVSAMDPFDNKVGRAYARYMHRWRALTLAYMPRWAVNTAIGSFFLNMVKGVTPRDYRLASELHKRSVFGEPRLGGVELGTVTGMEYLEPAALGQVDRMTGIGVTPLGERIVEKVQQIEDHFRRASFIHSLDKVAQRRMSDMGQVISNLERRRLSFYDTRQPWSARHDEKYLQEVLDDPNAVQEAIDDLNSFAYNFAALGPYERRYVRMAVPFWGWYKFISKVAYRLPVDYPGRTNVLANLGLLGTGHEDQQLGERPDWLHGIIPLSEKKGRLSYLSTMGQNPFSSFFNPFGPQGAVEGAITLGQASPPIQAVLSAFGLDTMRGGQVPISPEQGVAADYFGSLIDIQNGRETNPAEQAGVRRLIMGLLRSAPQIRMGEQYLAGGRSVYPESIPIFDQRAMPTEPRDTSLLSNLGTIFGVAPKTFNLGGYQKGMKKRVKYAKARNKTSMKRLRKSERDLRKK
jgi:hypothetical protein